MSYKKKKSRFFTDKEDRVRHIGNSSTHNHKNTSIHPSRSTAIQQHMQKEQRALNPAVFTVPMNKINANHMLIIPSGPSKDGHHWQKGVMQASSIDGAQRCAKMIRSMGFCGGTILAPMSSDNQPENKKSFTVVGKFGKKYKSPDAWDGKYHYDKELIELYLKLESGSKKKNVQLVMMSPETFLKQCPTPDYFSDKYKNANECPSDVGYSKEKVDAYKQKLLKNEKLDVLELDLRHTDDYGFNKKRSTAVGHDGRHRAKAAYLLGVKRIPVIVTTDTPLAIAAYKNEKLLRTAKRTFGTTENPDTAGYLLPDGHLLDSSRNGRKFYDHASTAKKVGSTVENFKKAGAVRFVAASRELNLEFNNSINRQQWQRIETIFANDPMKEAINVDVFNDNGRIVATDTFLADKIFKAGYARPSQNYKTMQQFQDTYVK